jgi:tripartite-type tricarboxylate transporter receptor subunit TctC
MIAMLARNRSWMRAIASLALVIVAALPFSPLAQENYPSRPVKMLVPYAPGGATDIIARQLASKLEQALGQPFVVENRAGASGNIALEAAAKAPADGYTLLVGNVSTNAINESTFAGVMQSKPSQDLVGITKLVEIPHVLVASTQFPPNTVAEVIDWAKKNPSKLDYASAGIGTFINLASTIEQIRAGRIKAIATTMPTRLAELPNVPTMAEQGFPGIGTNAWQALFAPAATPKPILDKLHSAVVAILSKPDMKEALAKQMMTVALSPSPEAFTTEVKTETGSWSQVVAEHKVKIE